MSLREQCGVPRFLHTSAILRPDFAVSVAVMLTHAAKPRRTRQRPLIDVSLATILAAAAVMAVVTANANGTVDAHVALSAEIIETRSLPAQGPLAQID